MRLRFYIQLGFVASLAVACGDPEPTARGKRFDELPDTERSAHDEEEEEAVRPPTSAAALPSALAPLDASGTIRIDINADGSCAANSVPLTSCAAVAGVARAAVAKVPGVSALLHADNKAKFSVIVEVLDSLNNAGVKDVQFSVTPLGAASAAPP